MPKLRPWTDSLISALLAFPCDLIIYMVRVVWVGEGFVLTDFSFFDAILLLTFYLWRSVFYNGLEQLCVSSLFSILLPYARLLLKMARFELLTCLVYDNCPTEFFQWTCVRWWNRPGLIPCRVLSPILDPLMNV